MKLDLTGARKIDIVLSWFGLCKLKYLIYWYDKYQEEKNTIVKVYTK